MSIKHGWLAPFQAPTTRELAVLADLYLEQGNKRAAEECIRQIYEAYDGMDEAELRDRQW